MQPASFTSGGKTYTQTNGQLNQPRPKKTGDYGKDYNNLSRYVQAQGHAQLDHASRVSLAKLNGKK